LRWLLAVSLEGLNTWKFFGLTLEKWNIYSVNAGERGRIGILSPVSSINQPLRTSRNPDLTLTREL
jgi:hypothetical protein